MFKLAYKALADRKVRSFLTILGITIGSAIILALIASSSGLNAGITSNIQKTGANILTVRNSGGYFSAGATNTYQLSQTDVTYLEGLPHVTHVYPYYSYSASIVSGSSTLSTSVVGINLAALPVLYNGLTVADGSLPIASDTTAAVIGWDIANPVSGTPITLHEMVEMTVSGISGAKSSGTPLAVLANAILAQYGTALSANIDDTVFVSFQAATLLSKTPNFSGIYVVVDNTNDVTTVQNTITSHYGSNARVVSPGTVLSSLQSITGQLTVFLGAIGAVSLFIATVGIVNTMYVSVMERTREIGIFKAIGYRPKEIMAMFLAEAALTGLIGGITGLMLGYVLSFLMGGELAGSTLSLGRGGFGGGGARTTATAAAIVPVFSTELIIFALTFPVLLATVAGLYPAWRASRMNAVAALKYE